MQQLADAQDRYDRAVAHVAAQHRYVAAAQREVVARQAILPNLLNEVERARRALDVASGRAEHRHHDYAADRLAQRLVDQQLHLARRPGDQLASAADPHDYSGDPYGAECWVGLLHRDGSCLRLRDDHHAEDAGHVSDDGPTRADERKVA